MFIGKYEAYKKETPHGELLLPRRHLSYSSIQKWLHDKDGYRRQYYEGEKPHSTKYTIFGNEVHKKIEDGELKLLDTDFHDYEHEKLFYMDVEGIKVKGYLDLWNEETCTFADIKTGKAPWDLVKLQKLQQLPFYSMLIQEKYRKVDDHCYLIWLKTADVEKEEHVVFDGHVLTNKTYVIELTGDEVVFRREIEQWERDKQKEQLIQVAKDISEDYRKYIEEHTVVIK